MMSKTFLVLLLICALVLQDSDAWRRRRRRRGRRFWKRVGRFVGGVVKTGLKAGANTLLGAFGKRDAENGEVLSDDVRQRLEQNCPALLGLDKDGLNPAHIQDAIQESDEDGDGALTGNEMVTFTHILEAIEMCEDMFEDSLSEEEGGQIDDAGQP